MKEELGPYPSLAQAWGIFGLFLAASIGIGLLIGFINDLSGVTSVSVGNFIGYSVSMLFVIWFAWRNTRIPVSEAFQFNKINSILYPFLITLTLSLSVLMDPLTNLIPIPEVMQQVFDMLSTRDIWTFMLVCILGPILEELLFRGIILDGFLRRYSPWKAILWSAFLFGLFHLNPWQFIPGFLIGILIGYIYWKTRSLITAVLIHIVNNSFSYLVIYFYGEDVDSYVDIIPDMRDYTLFLSAAAILFALSLFFIIRFVKNNNPSWTLE